MKRPIDDRSRLKHIMDSIHEIESYVENVSPDEFAGNSMMKHATVKLLEIIGEASNALSDALRASHPEIEWPKIIALRNLLVHQYFGIDPRIVWQIVTGDLPLLKEKIGKIIKGM